MGGKERGREGESEGKREREGKMESERRRKEGEREGEREGVISQLIITAGHKVKVQFCSQTVATKEVNHYGDSDQPTTKYKQITL